jgi:thiol-disulfide isomerase/thioredoxin
MKRRVLLAGAAAVGVAAALASQGVRAHPLAFGRGSWQALRRAHAGQKVIVHFWGLTCGPCLTELPAWGRFHQAHREMRLILVAADAIPQMPDALDATLAKAGLQDVEIWWFQDRFTDRLFWEVDHDWQGELPFTVLLDKDGTATTRTGTIDDFAALAA